jgi:HD superfamily phosphodiesterase
MMRQLVLFWVQLFFVLIERTGSQAVSKVLIMTVDDREILGDSSSALYPSFAAVVMHKYAEKHGYDYRYFQVKMNALELSRLYKLATPAAGLTTPRSYHPRHNQTRGTSWNKLPVLWHVATNMQEYDLVVYLDSDTVITSHTDRSISEAIREWSTSSSKITWGVTDLLKSAIMFFPNTPFGEQEPAIGAFIFRPKLAAAMFSEWWDYNLPQAANSPGFEQEALWKILNKDKHENFNFAISRSTCTLVKEQQYPLEQDKIEDWCLRRGWLCHLSHLYDAASRQKIFRKLIQRSHGKSETTTHSSEIFAKIFRSTISKIKEKEVIVIDMIPLIQKMPQSPVVQETAITAVAVAAAAQSRQPQVGASGASKKNEKEVVAEVEVEDPNIRKDNFAATENELRIFKAALKKWAQPIHKVRQIAERKDSHKLSGKAKEILADYIEGKIPKSKLDAFGAMLDKNTL